MARVLLISHEPEAAPALIGEVLRERGHETRTHVVLADPSAPDTAFPDPTGFDAVIAFGSFANAVTAPLNDLREIEGLGDAGAAALRIVQGAALRLARAEVMDRPLLNNWDRLLAYLTTMLSREKVEQFRVLFLDTRNRLIADEAQARGTVNHTPVYPREVVRRALELQATALILVHNHPSGDPTPSRADLEMTQEVKAAAAVLGVVLHDHLVVGNGRHLSFRREGLL